MFFKKFVACALICGFVTGVLANRITLENDSDFGAEGSGHGESPSTETSKSPSTTSSTDLVELFSSQQNKKHPIIRLISMPNNVNRFREGTEFKAQCLLRSNLPKWIFSKPQDQIKDLHIHIDSIYKDKKFYFMREIQFQITREHDKLELMCSGMEFLNLVAKFVIHVDFFGWEDSGNQKEIVIDDVPDDVKDPGLQANSSSKAPSCDSDGDSEAGSILGMQVAIGVLVLTVLVLVVLLFVVSRATGRLSIGGSKPSETNDN
ncbi:uncharacterized protein LOC108047770 [Drosophila rhopaloa]|uniref:Uncharacterized protein n=1 Tax=Drosophila rhopaloa TaxID=1041015 RepID=A0ABM5JB16_DRORH|nr:uncharacterized protein LOC108047770 [Drosophila rhopaloa]